MNLLLLAAGIVLLVGLGADVAATTTASGSASGAGPPTTRVAKLIWSGALRLHRRWPSHRALHLVGLLITSGVIATWIVGIWISWTLIFASTIGSVVDPVTRMPAGLGGKAYFAGYAVLTLGNGELVPASSSWRLVTLAATATGLGLVTLAVTYLLNLVQAGNRRRSLATTIWTLGDDAEDVVRRARQDPEGLTQQLWSIVDPLVVVSEQHVTFPVLHFLHVTDPYRALPVQVTKLDQAIRRIEEVDHAVSVSVLLSLRRALDVYQRTVARYQPASTSSELDAVQAVAGSAGWSPDDPA